jgi:hypothetical protein
VTCARWGSIWQSGLQNDIACICKGSFRWFANNGEGLPQKNIYEDEWLDSLSDTEESSWEYRDDEDATPFTERSEEYQDGTTKETKRAIY